MHWLDPTYWISEFGTAGLLLVVFVESGLIPAPLPGDSLLFLGGFFASGTKYGLNIWVIALGSFVVAVVGGQVGYFIGNRYGTKLFKDDARFFKTEYSHRAHLFFERQGPKAVIFARFIPFVRTIAPMLAGVSRMRQRTFLMYNAIGAFIWAIGISVAGYFLGDAIGQNNVDKYVLPIVAVIIVLSLIPPAIEYRNHRRDVASVAAGASLAKDAAGTAGGGSVAGAADEAATDVASDAAPSASAPNPE
jgi:membrane-associated protein